MSTPKSNEEQIMNITQEPSIADVIRIIYSHRKIVGAIVLLITTATVIVSITTPNTYTAKATIIPIEASSSGKLSSMLGSLGGGFGMFAAQAGLGGNDASDRFITILGSRTIAESVEKQLSLAPLLFGNRFDKENNEWKKSLMGRLSGKTLEPSQQEVLEKISENLTISRDKKSNVVVISFSHTDPSLAAKISNEFVKQLDIYIESNTLSTSRRNRIFIEGQLAAVRKELGEQEVLLQQFQEKNKLISLTAQAEAAVQAYSALKARLITSEIELKVLKRSSFDGDPRITLKNEEISEIKNQLKQYEENGKNTPTITFEQAPAMGINFAKLKRDLLVKEKVYEVLTQQYELAKVEEAQTEMSFQILDSAIPPEKKSAPRRTLNIVIALIASMVLGVLTALVIEFWKLSKKHILGTNKVT